LQNAVKKGVIIKKIPKATSPKSNWKISPAATLFDHITQAVCLSRTLPTQEL
jgi:hypothetical protein